MSTELETTLNNKDDVRPSSRDSVRQHTEEEINEEQPYVHDYYNDEDIESIPTEVPDDLITPRVLDDEELEKIRTSFSSGSVDLLKPSVIEKSDKPREKSKKSHSRSSSAVSDCSFSGRPTSVEFNIDSFSDEQLKDTVLQLENEWVFWFDDRRGLSKNMTTADYESSIKNLGKFNTIQDFWRYYNNLQDVSRLPDGTNIRLFKAGIKPTWEDPANIKGGKWAISTSKDTTHVVWSKIQLAIIGEQFEYSDQLTGAVVSIRNKGDTVNIWNKLSGNKEEIDSTTNELKQITGFTAKYSPHTKSLSSSVDRANHIQRSVSTSSLKVNIKEMEVPDDENGDRKKRKDRNHLKTLSVTEEDFSVPLTASLSVDAVSHRKTHSGDFTRRSLDINGRQDFRRSVDLNGSRKKTDRHSRTPSNSSDNGLYSPREDNNRHRRSPSSSMDRDSLHKRSPSTEIDSKHRRNPSNTSDSSDLEPRQRRTSASEGKARKANGLPPPYPVKKQNGISRVTSKDKPPMDSDTPTKEPTTDSPKVSKKETGKKPAASVKTLSKASYLGDYFYILIAFGVILGLAYLYVRVLRF